MKGLVLGREGNAVGSCFDDKVTPFSDKDYWTYRCIELFCKRKHLTTCGTSEYYLVAPALVLEWTE